MTLIETMAHRAAELEYASLSEDTVHATRRVILDWFAATIPGTATEFARNLAGAMGEELRDAGSDIFGDTRKASARTAAFINGSVSHAVEFDDIFRDAVYHPGCPVVGAALAIGQRENVSGEELFLAVIKGYELSTRIGAAVQPEHYRNWHTTGTVGCFGAAAAAASILKLDAERFAHALATVGTFAAGLQQAFRSDSVSKPMHAGRAAEAGVTAALTAQQGMKGALDILEGDAGFGVATAAGKVDWSKATEGLLETFNIERITVKNHGCCGHIFAAIDGALALQAEHDIDSAAIESITVKTYQTAVDVVGGRTVTTPFEGRFSLRFCVASALIHGSIRLDAFERARIEDARVQELMTRFELVADAERTAAFPTQRSAEVVIRMNDGREFSRLQPHRKGDPELPLTDDELVAKYTELAVPVVGEAQADALRAEIWALDGNHLRQARLNWAD